MSRGRDDTAVWNPYGLVDYHTKQIARARNWGLVCGFGYGFAAATFAFMILLFVTAPHA